MVSAAMMKMATGEGPPLRKGAGTGLLERDRLAEEQELLERDRLAEEQRIADLRRQRDMEQQRTDALSLE